MRINGGANLVERQPAFSADGKLLLVCTGCTVSVYSVATGLLVNQLEGHIAPVTSLNVVHYSGPAKSVISHVWTSSLDGTVRFWDFCTGSLIRTVSVGQPIVSMVIPGLLKGEAGSPSKGHIAFMLVKWEKGLCDNAVDSLLKGQNGALDGKKNKKVMLKNLHYVNGLCLHVILHNLSNGKPLPGHLAKVSTAQSLVCSQFGGLVGMVDKRKIWVWKVPKKMILNTKSVEVTVLHHTKAMQALAFDPTDTMVAGSDANGRILIWKNVGERCFSLSAQVPEEEWVNKEKNKGDLDMNRGARGHDDAASLTTYHWHSDEVKFLTFSVDGAYLLSGGKEAVFVMWQLETGKRQFLPRLGSTLLYCANSSDASVFSVSCADNTIQLVNIGTMTVQKTIQGIKPPACLPERMNKLNLTRVAIQPGAGSLVLPTESMSLQFYDAFYDRHIGEVEVSPCNYVSSWIKGKESSEKACISGPTVFVTHVVFSIEGSDMATAEARIADEGIGGSSCLKFWRQKSVKTDFCINTEVDEPHSTRISSLAHHPLSSMVVSCCEAGEFKVWVQNENKNDNQTALNIPSWRCRSVGSYQQKPMHCAAFSPDGSLLAIAAEELITLWNPTSNGLVHVLGGNAFHPVKLLAFVPMTHHLISASSGSQPQLTVWSLENLSISWSYVVETEAIAVEPDGRHFAIVAPLKQRLIKSKQNRALWKAQIALFDVDIPLPSALWNAQDVEGSIAFFIPSATISTDSSRDSDDHMFKKSHLLFMSQQREYMIFDPFIADESNAASIKRFNAPEKQGPSAFEAVFGKAAIPQVEAKIDTANVKIVQPLTNLLNSPSHLISLTKIGFSYLESLMEKRINES